MMRISDWSSDVCSSDLRQQQHDLELPESLGLFLELRPEPNGEVLRDAELRQPPLNRVHRVAQGRLHFSVDTSDALLVLSLDLDGTRFGVDNRKRGARGESGSVRGERVGLVRRKK